MYSSRHKGRRGLLVYTPPHGYSLTGRKIRNFGSGLITSGKQIQKMKSAAPEERQQLFDQFWQQRDPTPGTPENELRVEFFNRIDYANRNFSEPTSSTDGWKTDRGRVLLRNGAPDDVERQAVEPGMPTVEIWQYTRLNKRYIFVDQQGMGEFRLVKVE